MAEMAEAMVLSGDVRKYGMLQALLAGGERPGPQALLAAPRQVLPHAVAGHQLLPCRRSDQDMCARWQQ
jgi:hypothetical protein